MNKCCGNQEPPDHSSKPGQPPPSSCCSGGKAAAPQEAGYQTWFAKMIPNCLEAARRWQEQDKPVVGILCEYTPRELIMAAGGLPVCLCGGSQATIASAEAHLPTNLCPLIKSTYGYHMQRSNPFLEMADLLVAETTCDGKKKMYERLGESRPMYVLELPQKQGNGDALKHWEIELRKFKRELESRFGVEIPNERVVEASRLMNRERALRRQLAERMKDEPPPMTGRQLLDLKSSISGLAKDLEQYEEALRRLKAKGGEPALSSRVRVLMTGVPMVHGAERVLEIIEDRGGVVVCLENCTGLKPILEDVDAEAPDPVRALAERYFHLPCSVMTRNDARMESLKRLAAEYRPECVIELIWQACLTYDVESWRVRQLAEREMGVPYLRIETDYSPSDSARIAVRVEALFETVRSRAPRERA